MPGMKTFTKPADVGAASCRDGSRIPELRQDAAPTESKCHHFVSLLCSSVAHFRLSVFSELLGIVVPIEKRHRWTRMNTDEIHYYFAFILRPSAAHFFLSVFDMSPS